MHTTFITKFILHYDQLILAALAFITAFITTYSLLPLIIRWSVRKNLLDRPDGRKVHSAPISRLGGVGIFSGLMITALIWFYLGDQRNLAFLILALFILFVVGVVDDFNNLSPRIKFLGQILAAFIISFTGLRIESLYGIFGIQDLPVVMQYIFTIFLVTGIINALNLIDGIDGLAGGLGLISLLVISAFLVYQEAWMFAIVGISAGGALLAFLRYNFSPAMIFMGDAGSLLIGFLLAILGIKVIAGNPGSVLSFASGETAVLISGTLLVPVYDTLRVFLARVLKGHSPFRADNTHIHHLILHTGILHRNAAIILYVAHILVIATAFLLKGMHPGIAVFILTAEAIVLSEGLTLRKIFLSGLRKRSANQKIESLRAENKLISNHFNKNH